MKKLTLPLLLLIGMSVKSQELKPYFTVDAGVSNKSINYHWAQPVVGISGGYELRFENSKIKPFGEASIRAHVDNKNIAFGALNAGIEYNNVAFLIGGAYGGNRQKEDTYFNPETGETIVLQKGAKSSSFISPVYAIRKVFVIWNSNVYLQGTYCYKNIFASVGIKMILGE